MEKGSDKARRALAEKQRKAREQLEKARQQLDEARQARHIVESLESNNDSVSNNDDDDDINSFEFGELEICKNCQRSDIFLTVVNKKDM
jgi:hypothetical protein